MYLYTAWSEMWNIKIRHSLRSCSEGSRDLTAPLQAGMIARLLFLKILVAASESNNHIFRAFHTFDNIILQHPDKFTMEFDENMKSQRTYQNNNLGLILLDIQALWSKMCESGELDSLFNP